MKYFRIKQQNGRQISAGPAEKWGMSRFSAGFLLRDMHGKGGSRIDYQTDEKAAAGKTIDLKEALHGA